MHVKLLLILHACETPANTSCMWTANICIVSLSIHTVKSNATIQSLYILTKTGLVLLTLPRLPCKYCDFLIWNKGECSFYRGGESSATKQLDNPLYEEQELRMDMFSQDSDEDGGKCMWCHLHVMWCCEGYVVWKWWWCWYICIVNITYHTFF